MEARLTDWQAHLLTLCMFYEGILNCCSFREGCWIWPLVPASIMSYDSKNLFKHHYSLVCVSPFETSRLHVLWTHLLLCALFIKKCPCHHHLHREEHKGKGSYPHLTNSFMLLFYTKSPVRYPSEMLQFWYLGQPRLCHLWVSQLRSTTNTGRLRRTLFESKGNATVAPNLQFAKALIPPQGVTKTADFFQLFQQIIASIPF